jgi:hypothetical protein
VTLLLACAGSLLFLVMGGFVADLALASSQRMRAQIAADAAALAAVAESAPHGSSDPEGEARRYAQLNGARLVKCRCGPGAVAAEVEVEVGDVAAHARAVLDVALLAPERWTFEHRGLHPVLARAVERLVDASRGEVWVVSGFRSAAEQRALWEAALARYGSAERADDWVAPPRRSMHQRGLAVDLGGDVERAAVLVVRLGLPLHRPLSNEPWHFELTGSRP